MATITPFLWFDHQAEEAANFYVSVFKNSKITGISRYAESGPGPQGAVMTVAFELNGEAFTALNGGPHFKFTEAVSFVVNCDDQAEVDHYWSTLSGGGGQEVECGWLKDGYGLSWQIVPKRLMEILAGGDPALVGRVMAVVMRSKKLVIAELDAAAAG